MPDVSSDGPLPAGDFARWLDGTLAGWAEGRDADVPCDGCTACCTSAQFVHIEPDERATLDRVPDALKFAAPGRPRGHVVIGYDEHGRCPMLVDDGCSIYADRPRACRTYDCRVFAATGLEPDGPAKVELVARVRRWRFTYASARERAAHDELRARARARRAAAASSTSTTELALEAIEAHAADRAEARPRD